MHTCPGFAKSGRRQIRPWLDLEIDIGQAHWSYTVRERQRLGNLHERDVEEQVIAVEVEIGVLVDVGDVDLLLEVDFEAVADPGNDHQSTYLECASVNM